MKKSERAKIKFGVIRELKAINSYNKRVLKRNWRYRHSEGYKEAIKTDLANIHSCLFSLRAAEKQIPMPVKIYVKPTFFHLDDNHLYFNVRSYYCQNCGEKLFRMGDGSRPKYCPHCGQKLWWPK